LANVGSCIRVIQRDPPPPEVFAKFAASVGPFTFCEISLDNNKQGIFCIKPITYIHYLIARFRNKYRFHLSRHVVTQPKKYDGCTLDETRRADALLLSVKIPIETTLCTPVSTNRKVVLKIRNRQEAYVFRFPAYRWIETTVSTLNFVPERTCYEVLSQIAESLSTVTIGNIQRFCGQALCITPLITHIIIERSPCTLAKEKKKKFHTKPNTTQK
jgi:hypothetical protein